MAVVVAEVSASGARPLQILDVKPDFEFRGPESLQVLKLLEAEVAAELLIRYIERGPELLLVCPPDNH